MDNFCINIERKESVEPSGKTVGLDVGIKEFYTDSNGETVDNPRFLRKGEKRLKQAHSGTVVKKSLSTRTHVCQCGCELDRDHNAALNILQKGIGTVGHTGTWVLDPNASGEMTSTLAGVILSEQVASQIEESPLLQHGECQAALTYYYANREEIEADLAQEEESM